MSDYINREAALAFQDELEPVMCFPCHGDKDANVYSATKDAELVSYLQSIPAADVRPVVHGRWIKPTRVPDSMLDECSVCGFDTGAYTFNFCPNCGADMRKES